MEPITLEPKNKKELNSIISFLEETKIHSSLKKENNLTKKRKAKEAFLDSLPQRLNEVKLHMQGKIKLKSWDELYDAL